MGSKKPNQDTSNLLVSSTLPLQCYPPFPSSMDWDNLECPLWREVALTYLELLLLGIHTHHHQYLNQLVSTMGFKMESIGGTIFMSGLPCGFWMSYWGTETTFLLTGFPCLFPFSGPLPMRKSLPPNTSLDLPRPNPELYFWETQSKHQHSELILQKTAFACYCFTVYIVFIPK